MFNDDGTAVLADDRRYFCDMAGVPPAGWPTPPTRWMAAKVAVGLYAAGSPKPAKDKDI